MKKILILLSLLILSGTGAGAVELNSLFSDHMVLQRDKALPVWGTGRDGEEVEVKLGEQSAKTTVTNGKWRVDLQPLPAGGPLTLTVTGDNALTVNDVLVGEVWVCSGQSNMERQLGPRNGQKPLENWEQEVAAADHPQLRMFFVPVTKSPEPRTDARGKWVVCSPETAKDFSAVGYFFARALQAELKVPVGMVFSSVGGTAAELWISPEALANNPAGMETIQANDKETQGYAEKLAKFKEEEPALLEKHAADVAAAKEAGKPEPRKPSPPRDPSGVRPGCLSNGMIAPLIPYAMRGVIWYQGEANAGRGKQYRELFPLLIQDWRGRWGQGDFPFLFVQVAPYRSADPAIREAQFMTLARVPNTAMAVTTDVGDAADIHPTRKQPVGERLALAARATAYGEKLEFSGPIYEGFEIKDGKIIVRFAHANGLAAKDGPLGGFVIAGADNKFVPADAVVEGETVVLSSPSVSAPVAVRYGWAQVPEGNLVNAAGLPASPFRTDQD